MATQQITRRTVHSPSTGRERTGRDSRFDRAVAASARRRVTLRGVAADRADQNDAVKIVIADDHAVVRSGLRMLLDSEAGFEVVAEAGDVDSARRYVRGHHPAVLVLDLNMPGGSSLEAIPGLREEFPETEIVVLTMQDDPAFAREAMRAGARGYVL